MLPVRTPEKSTFEIGFIIFFPEFNFILYEHIFVIKAVTGNKLLACFKEYHRHRVSSRVSQKLKSVYVFPMSYSVLKRLSRKAF